MKEYDIFVPLYFNDGAPVKAEKFQQLQEALLDRFGGVTFFPQPNKGLWRMAGATYRDEIVIYRVIASAAEHARPFLAQFKQRRLFHPSYGLQGNYRRPSWGSQHKASSTEAQ